MRGIGPDHPRKNPAQPRPVQGLLHSGLYRCVYGLNGARGFLAGFWQLLVILSVMNLMDRFLVDDWWVGHTPAWTIPGTEDLKPYINGRDKCVKWAFGTLGMAGIAAALSGVMTLILG